MVVGILQVRIMIRNAQSLKDKRRIVKSLRDRIRNRFNVSVSEVDSLDLRQQATLGIALATNDPVFADQVLAKVVDLVLRDAGRLARGLRNRNSVRQKRCQVLFCLFLVTGASGKKVPDTFSQGLAQESSRYRSIGCRLSAASATRAACWPRGSGRSRPHGTSCRTCNSVPSPVCQ